RLPGTPTSLGPSDCEAGTMTPGDRSASVESVRRKFFQRVLSTLARPAVVVERRQGGMGGFLTTTVNGPGCLNDGSGPQFERGGWPPETDSRARHMVTARSHTDRERARKLRNDVSAHH